MKVDKKLIAIFLLLIACAVILIYAVYIENSILLILFSIVPGAIAHVLANSLNNKKSLMIVWIFIGILIVVIVILRIVI